VAASAPAPSEKRTAPGGRLISHCPRASSRRARPQAGAEPAVGEAPAGAGRRDRGHRPSAREPAREEGDASAQVATRAQNCPAAGKAPWPLRSRTKSRKPTPNQLRPGRSTHHRAPAAVLAAGAGPGWADRHRRRQPALWATPPIEGPGLGTLAIHRLSEGRHQATLAASAGSGRPSQQHAPRPPSLLPAFAGGALQTAPSTPSRRATAAGKAPSRFGLRQPALPPWPGQFACAPRPAPVARLGFLCWRSPLHTSRPLGLKRSPRSRTHLLAAFGVRQQAPGPPPLRSGDACGHALSPEILNNRFSAVFGHVCRRRVPIDHAARHHPTSRRNLLAEPWPRLRPCPAQRHLCTLASREAASIQPLIRSSIRSNSSRLSGRWANGSRAQRSKSTREPALWIAVPPPWPSSAGCSSWWRCGGPWARRAAASDPGGEPGHELQHARSIRRGETNTCAGGFTALDLTIKSGRPAGPRHRNLATDSPIENGVASSTSCTRRRPPPAARAAAFTPAPSPADCSQAHSPEIGVGAIGAIASMAP